MPREWQLILGSTNSGLLRFPIRLLLLSTFLHDGDVLGQCPCSDSSCGHPTSPSVQEGSFEEQLFEERQSGVEAEIVDMAAFPRAPSGV
ncbi:MAG: hypothetical protein HOJ54_09730 [Phycisphaerae bacterium]|nr:hypothetical protein [Phycisphaerae bacterium]